MTKYYQYNSSMHLYALFYPRKCALSKTAVLYTRWGYQCFNSISWLPVVSIVVNEKKNIAKPT